MILRKTLNQGGKLISFVVLVYMLTGGLPAMMGLADAPPMDFISAVASFILIGSLMFGGIYMVGKNNKRLVFEFTLIVMVYYWAFFEVVFPILYLGGPYPVMWADALCGIGIAYYLYNRTRILTWAAARIGPHLYIQDKHLNKLAVPLGRWTDKGRFPRWLYKLAIRGMTAVRKGGKPQQAALEVIRTTGNTNLGLFLCGFVALSLAIDTIYAAYAVDYASRVNVPWFGSIFETLTERGDFDFFMARDMVQMAMSYLSSMAIIIFTVLDWRRPDRIGWQGEQVPQNTRDTERAA